LKFAYYPGCTQETTSREYHDSVLAVGAALGIELAELPGWTCCGAASGHATDYWLSHALAGRNLALAEKQRMDLAVACPACYLRLNDTRHEFMNAAKLKERLPSLIDLPYGARYRVRHILDIIGNSVGVEALSKQIVKPLASLKVVAYYGCYLVRPPELTGFDDPENPQTMDNLLKAAGAQVPDWRGKVECCGGNLSLTGRDVVRRLVAEITEAACEVAAEAIVTACPLCQTNLEARQPGKSPLPVFFFTELLGLALGLKAEPWLKRHLISPLGLIRKKELIYGLLTR
jgi:heterodisulfide reductase subunit B